MCMHLVTSLSLCIVSEWSVGSTMIIDTVLEGVEELPFSVHGVMVRHEI